MNRKQKRYTSEKEILARIEELTQERGECLQSSTHLEDLNRAYAIEIEKLSGSRTVEAKDRIAELEHAIRQNLEVIVKTNKRGHAIEDSYLPRMKEVLAAFRTELMTFTDDPGVVA